MRALVLLAAVAVVHAQVPIGSGQVVILAGPPGSGKTVQSSRLSKKYKIPAISLASVLEESLKLHGELHPALKASVAGGELLDDRTAIDLIGARIAKPDAARGFVLDGYPATEDQAKFLDRFVATHNLGRPIVIVLRAPDEVLRQRLRRRRRADDTPENIERRLRALKDECAFLEHWYEGQNTVNVDATAKPEQVFQAIQRGIDGIYERRALKTR